VQFAALSVACHYYGLRPADLGIKINAARGNSESSSICSKSVSGNNNGKHQAAKSRGMAYGAGVA